VPGPSVQGGALTHFGGALHIENSIIAGNAHPDGTYVPEFYSTNTGPISVAGANLIGSNATVQAYFPPGPLVGTSALLAPLGDYGGPTPTMPPFVGSRAIDAVIATAASPVTDQRGEPRPQGLRPDLGAVEGFLPAPTITLSATALATGVVGSAYPSTTITQTGGTDPVTFAVTQWALPAGLTLSSDGAISGTPTAAGSFPFTVTATDANGFTGSRAYTLTVQPSTFEVVWTLSTGLPARSATSSLMRRQAPRSRSPRASPGRRSRSRRASS